MDTSTDTATIEPEAEKPSVPEPLWYMDHSNIVTLATYLADRGDDAHDVVRAVEKPWNYEDEYREALQAIAADQG
jgi:hypothetical protein